MQFLLDKSQTFTRAGAVRIDDSIRAYVYCILGSQAQTRSNIMKSLECQQNFVDLLESHINSLFSIPESIQKYQDAISNTGVRINYAVGIGLYMIPSDLVLKVGVTQKYNNNLVIANDDAEIGINEDINLIAAQRALDLPTTEAPAPKEASSRSSNTTEIAVGISFVVFISFLAFYSK